MIPPTVEKAPNFFDIAEDVAATTIQVMMTILEYPAGFQVNYSQRDEHLARSSYVECPSEKYVPTVTGRWLEATSRLVIRSIAFFMSIQRMFVYEKLCVLQIYGPHPKRAVIPASILTRSFQKTP